MSEEKVILTADAGGTSTDWLLTVPGAPDRRFRTQGINPAVLSDSEIEVSIRDVVHQISGSPAHIDEVRFYGAGCRPGKLSQRVAAILERYFSGAHIEVNSDILGAARALFGNSPGICCILGTGSASCLYDGNRIVKTIPSLGYILGDEGSGAALGRRLLNQYFKGGMTAEISESFRKAYPGLTLEETLERVYRSDRAANTWLASFAPFCSAHLDDRSVSQLVENEFMNFLTLNVLPYLSDSPSDPPVGFVGSVAYSFRDMLAKMLTGLHLTPGKFLRSPLG